MYFFAQKHMETCSRFEFSYLYVTNFVSNIHNGKCVATVSIKSMVQLQANSHSETCSAVSTNEDMLSNGNAKFSMFNINAILFF